MEYASRAIRSSFIRDTILTTLFSTLGKGVGFLVPILIAAWFGVSHETDAFFFAYGIILFLISVFLPVVKSVLVPYMAEITHANQNPSTLLSTLAVSSVVSVFVACALLAIFAKPLLGLVTKFDTSTIDLVFVLLLESLALVIATVFAGILEGVLDAYKKFSFPAVSPAFRSLICIFVILLLKDKLGVHSIAIGYIIGEAVRSIMLLTYLSQKELFTFKPTICFDSSYLGFLKTAFFQSLGMLVLGLTPIVDQTMASWLGAGKVSILTYAERLYMVPVTFGMTGLMVTALSHWSSDYAKFGIERLKLNVRRTIGFVALGAAFFTILLIALRNPIIMFAYGRESLDENVLGQIRGVWVFYLLGLLPKLVGMLFVRSLLVLKRTSLIMKISFFSFIINVLFNYVLINKIGIYGIPLATTIVALIISSLCCYFLFFQGRIDARTD